MDFKCFLGLIRVDEPSTWCVLSLLLLHHFQVFPSPFTTSIRWQSVSFVILRNETLTHVTVHQGNGKRRLHRMEKFSLSLKRTWNNIIPSWLTQVAWLYLSFLLLILHLFLGLFCCKMGDFGSQRKLLIVLLLRRFEKCSNALENTNVWTVMKHSLNTLIWWHSTPKFINSQLYLEWEKLTVWWMRRMSGHDRKKEMRTEWLTRSTGQRWKLPSICQLCIPLHTPRPPFDWLAPFQI